MCVTVYLSQKVPLNLRKQCYSVFCGSGGLFLKSEKITLVMLTSARIWTVHILAESLSYKLGNRVLKTWAGSKGLTKICFYVDLNDTKSHDILTLLVF